MAFFVRSPFPVVLVCTKQIRPPYRREWIGDVPGVGEFEAADLSGEAITDEDRASWRLYHSIDHADFSQYIIPRGVGKISLSPLCQALFGEKLIEFKSFVLPYLNGDIVDDLGFDISLARRWILSRVFELGWCQWPFENPLFWP